MLLNSSESWSSSTDRSELNKITGPQQTMYPRIVKVAAGGSFSIALSVDNECFTWGLSASGKGEWRRKLKFHSFKENSCGEISFF
jgi:alpha-tubulin suppressor-like RCC1 family protein